MRFLRVTVTAAAFAASALSPALGATLTGAYEFQTYDQKGGAPVCVEHWDFGADNVLTVHSGDEITRSHFSLSHDTVGDWLVTSTISTNGKPDCMGHVQTSVRKDETKSYWFATNDGTVNLCPPPAQNPVFISGCFASLRQEEPAGANRPEN